MWMFNACEAVGGFVYESERLLATESLVIWILLEHS